MSSRSIIAALVLSTTLAGAAQAQDWPARHVTMVVPFAPGSTSDTIGRLIAARLSEALGQQVIVESVSGGGGMIGSNRVARAEPDGYQFVFGSVDTVAIVPAIRKSPLYNSLTDFTPVALVVELPILLTARKDLPANTIAEFVTYAKANHRNMKFGSSGVGSGSHFSCAQLNAALGIDPIHVPYRGGSLSIQDLISGQIDFVCPIAAAAMGAIQSGGVKAVGLLTNERSPLFPALGTAKEQGVSGVGSRFWMAFFLPKNTPDPIVQKLYAATDKVLNEAVVIDRLKLLGATPIAANERSPAFLKSYIASEVETWAAMVKASGVKIE